MALPPIPIATGLAIEGLYQAHIFNPTQSQITRYSTEVMDQLKNELWQMVKQMKPLMTFSYALLIPGQSRYSCPVDFSSDMTMVILTGMITGPVNAGALNTLNVPSSVGPLSADQTLGKEIVITGGSASSSASQIVGVLQNADGSTTLSVYPNFQAIPDFTSTFMIVDNQYPVEADHIANLDKFRSGGIGRPSKFFPMGDEDFDEFIFDVAPDATYPYAVRMRYYVNIMTLDLSSTLMSTLYQKFRDYWIAGIKHRALADNMNDEQTEALSEKANTLQRLVMSQQYGTDIHALREHVEDYY